MPGMFNRVRGRITERFGTISAFCEVCGYTKQAMSLKLTGKQDFTYEQICKISKILEIPSEEIGLYFFSPESSQK